MFEEPGGALLTCLCRLVARGKAGESEPGRTFWRLVPCCCNGVWAARAETGAGGAESGTAESRAELRSGGQWG